MAHPAKMLPAVAAHAIAHYTRPGELVLDPMCGIGTTLVEAVRTGRAARSGSSTSHAGPHDRPRQPRPGRRRRPAPGAGRVITGDARHLDSAAPARRCAGRWRWSSPRPPYGPLHPRAGRHRRRTGIHKTRPPLRQRPDRGNLANIGHHRLLTGFTRILTVAARYLRPGGHVVITVRPWREHAELIDLPAQIQACGRHAGLVPVERCVALLGRVTDNGGFVARGSFFQRDFIRQTTRHAACPCTSSPTKTSCASNAPMRADRFPDGSGIHRGQVTE